MLVVLVERRLPGRLLRCRVDLHGADEPGNRRQHRARDLADRAIGGECDPLDPAVAVLDDRFVAAQVERHCERTGTVGRRQRQRLPPAHAEAQRRVLKLRLGWGKSNRQLAEHLRVPMQRVARRAPLLVRQPPARWRSSAGPVGEGGLEPLEEGNLCCLQPAACLVELEPLDTVDLGKGLDDP